jgi:hypothetical protein
MNNIALEVTNWKNGLNVFGIEQVNRLDWIVAVMVRG